MLTKTTTALLEGLGDPANEAIWGEFSARFRPVLMAFAQRLGFAPDDAEDIAQEALLRFVKGYREGKYDRQRGRLRSWLIGIARHCILDLQAERAARRERRGLSAIAEIEDEGRLTQLWDEELRQELLRQAVTELRQDSRMDPRTIRAFELLAFEQHSTSQVAAELTMTANDVYLAKHRCLKCIRNILAKLNQTYEIA